MRRWSIACVLFVSACAPPGDANDRPGALPPSPPPAASPLRVLAVPATAGFRHGSIPVAMQVLQSIATATHDFEITFTENLADLSGSRLATIDVLMFVLTSGELAIDVTQKAALLSFVQNGGGFIGVHSATDTLYDWPE